MMAKTPKNPDGAKALLAASARRRPIDAYIGVNPSVVAANGKADTAATTRCRPSRPSWSASAKYISQFLDRDTDPDFASQVVGKGLADFISDPSSIDTVLSTIEEQKQTYTFE